MGAERERVAGFGRLEDGLRQAGDASLQTGWTGLVADLIRRHGAVASIGDAVRQTLAAGQP